MSYSSETFTGLAGIQTYEFQTLRFLAAEYLTLTVDGAGVAFTVSDDRTEFTIDGAAIVGGEEIIVTRSTPAGDDERLVDFRDLSHVRQSDLDTSSLQLLHIAQETLDVVASAERLEIGVSGHWAAEARRIQNLADGVLDTDAITVDQLNDAAVALGNLPAPGAEDSGLAVVAGAWAVRSPAQMRTHLGLGTAAVLNAGTSANQVPQFDGSARYPANDGRNIDLTANAVTTALNLRYRSTVGQMRNAVEQTPTNSASATWYESGSSILTLGSLVALDNSSDIAVASNIVTLSAGTWEIQYTVRAYNLNNTAGNDQTLRLHLADDENSGAQVTYDDQYDRIDIEAAGSGNRALWTLENTVLLKLASGGTLTLRAANETSVDIRIVAVNLTCRKVSTST